MAALGSKLRSAEGGHLLFRCPGCQGVHMVAVGEGTGPRWGYNGNPDAPTFTPSILVRGHQIVTDDDGRWTGDWVMGSDGQPLPMICHSFVTDGRIQFLGDCTHNLAGQTVPLPDFSEGA